MNWPTWIRRAALEVWLLNGYTDGGLSEEEARDLRQSEVNQIAEAIGREWEKEGKA